MQSLEQRCKQLYQDLTAAPLRISSYNDLPFAILQYLPRDEIAMRREIQMLARKLEIQGKIPVLISLADLLWQSIEKSDDGLDGLIHYEKKRGFNDAQQIATTYLSHKEWAPLPDTLQQKVADLSPEKHIVLLSRAAAMGPAIYHMSKLLDEMHNRTLVPMILFYPGSLTGVTGLRFMDLSMHEPMGNYRVKIY